jgi:isopentenyl diphosphate isomerase/L-lactate dehydrogenase-like FMN-dependent dehydrogenase
MSESSDAVGDSGVSDLAARARELVDPRAWQYLVGGSGDNHTLRSNVTGWAAVALAPRMLVGVGERDTRLRLLGHDLAAPILVAPTASHGLFHPRGEVETAQGAAGSLFVASTNSTCPVEDIGAAATGPWWFQVYVQEDRDFTRELVARAEQAGAAALVLTIDLPVAASGTAARRDQVVGLAGSAYGNLAGLQRSPAAVSRHRPNDPDFTPTLTWADVGWLRSLTALPVLVKGVLRPDDADRAVAQGVAGVIVSNHGGRALDTVPATVDVLPSVVAAVAGRVPVLVDGGIRRGTDIAKALCLGANAVLVGRPVVWGLAVGGADGVRTVLDTLQRELADAMALLGAPTLADLTPDLLWRG